MNAHLTQMNLAAAGLAHETRNPLNLIRGLAQMIAMEAPASPKLKQHASSIVEEADRVTVQLNEFIHYSKPREAHLAPVEVSALVADVARTLQPDIEEKQIQLTLPPAPLTVSADSALFRQAIFNLLLNAVQAVGVGGKIAVQWSTNDQAEAILEIQDDGPGVAAADRTNIFKPYVTMRPKGVGLGLAIVQQIIAAHNWEIVCLENQPRGAIFRISHLKVTGGAVGAKA
jgi:two-component system, NtrC family, sensor histidine kinase HydH